MFGFLKDKLKEWVTGAKEKIEPEKTLEETEQKAPELVETPKEEAKAEPASSKETEIIEPKQKKPSKKQKDNKKEKTKSPELEIPSPTSIEISEKVAEPIVEVEPVLPEETIEEPKIEITHKELPQKLEEGITPKEALEEPAENLEETEQVEIKKPGLLSRIFGKKEEKIPSKVPVEIEPTLPEEVIAPKAKPEPPEVLATEPVAEKKSFFEKVKSSFNYKITPEDFESLFEELEMLLLENNVAMEVVEDIKLKLSKKLIGKEIKRDELEEEIKKELKATLNEILIDPDDPIDAIKLKKDKPFVMLFFGINGTGKTTSIAKLAYQLKQKNISVVLAAADTFRAASIEQISEHAKKLDIPVIKHEYGADPSAVGFDAIKYAKNHNIDVVLIDTAGRMHTKTNLLAEMEKIVRVTKPDLKIFVAESIAGNDATEQAKSFHESVNIDGSILSKADVDEKGGTIISVSKVTNKPIFYLGTGQNYSDLKLFNKQDYIESLGL